MTIIGICLVPCHAKNNQLCFLSSTSGKFVSSLERQMTQGHYTMKLEHGHLGNISAIQVFSVFIVDLIHIRTDKDKVCTEDGRFTWDSKSHTALTKLPLLCWYHNQSLTKMEDDCKWHAIPASFTAREAGPRKSVPYFLLKNINAKWNSDMNVSDIIQNDNHS